MTVGNNIRRYRINKGWSQVELSKRSSIHEVSISRYEANKVYPQLPQVRKIAEALNVSVFDIITDYFEDFTEQEINEFIGRKLIKCRECEFYKNGLCVRETLNTSFPMEGFCSYSLARSDSKWVQCENCVKNDVCKFKEDNNGKCLYFASNQ